MEEIDRATPAASSSRTPSTCGSVLNVGLFMLAVLGFSFWFFIGVPFASHRESYWWLGMVQSHPFTEAFAFISKTYRPLAQGLTWFGFAVLDPRTFPTSMLRQTLLQCGIYTLFIVAWWLVYSRAAHRRLFAILAVVTGAVFFSGYVQLFHIYGIFYAPVILMVGMVLHLEASKRFVESEVWCAIVAAICAFWHPFATALFLGFYAGFYVETFRVRNRAQHRNALLVLLVTSLTVVVLVVLFPTRADALSLGERIKGFVISYRTNELNIMASAVAGVLAQVVIFSINWPTRRRIAAAMSVAALSVVMVATGIPILLLWIGAVLLKLCLLRRWSLLLLTIAASLLPFGGGIGTPIYVTFAICTAVYVTQLEYSAAEKWLRRLETRHVVGMIVTAAMVVLMVRSGVDVPVVTTVGRRLLAERERTYQLEEILAWLHRSDYCRLDLAFNADGGNPTESVENVITREYRPPASIEDVQLFWRAALQCPPSQGLGDGAFAVVTFGGQPVPGATPVFKVDGKYAGEAMVWIRSSEKIGLARY